MDIDRLIVWFICRNIKSDKFVRDKKNEKFGSTVLINFLTFSGQKYVFLSKNIFFTGYKKFMKLKFKFKCVVIYFSYFKVLKYCSRKINLNVIWYYIGDSIKQNCTAVNNHCYDKYMPTTLKPEKICM